jgi:3-dehydroquinate dehydratase
MIDLQSRSERELIEKIHDMKDAMATALVDVSSWQYDSAILLLQSELDKLE